MIEISAPWPNIVSTTKLPNPSLGDGEALTSSLTAKRAMNGSLYTYVKTSVGFKTLSMSFVLTRGKGEEFKRFLVAYASKQIKLTDQQSQVWLGYFITNPIDFTTVRRGSPGGAGELVEVSLDFEGELQ